MRFVVILLMLLVVIPSLAEAATESNAYAISTLEVAGSDFSAIRTVVDNAVISPDLNFDSDVMINTEYAMSEKGSCTQTQSISSSVSNNEGLAGMATLSYSFSGTQVTDTNLQFTGSLKMNVPNAVNQYMVKTTNFGFSLASPGTDDYTLILTGGHKTVSTGTLMPAPEWQTEDPKIFSVSLDEYPMNLDQPADKLQENVNLNFNIVNNEVAYYGYDFSRDLTIGDVSSSSAMKLFHNE